MTFREQMENFHKALRDLRDAIAQAARNDLRRIIKLVRG